MPAPLHALIDESGDAGTAGKGSRWLVIALTLDLGRPGELATLIEHIRADVQRRKTHLHFAQIRNVSRKLKAYRQLAGAPITTIIVAIDTSAFSPGQGLSQPAELYKFGLFFAIERASQIAGALGRPLAITVEESDLFQVEQFRVELDDMRNESLDLLPHMHWASIDSALVNAASKEGEIRLGAADAAAHAFFRAIEPRFDDDIHAPMYGDMLLPTLWRGPAGATLAGNGFIFVPRGREREFVDELEVTKEWLVAGKQVAPLLWRHRARSANRTEGGQSPRSS